MSNDKKNDDELTMSKMQKMIVDDLEAVKDNLFNDLLDNARIHGKYINMLASHRVKQKVLEKKLAETKRDRWFFYTGRSDHEVYEHALDKSDTKFVLETDKDVLHMKGKIEVIEVKIKLLEDACKSFVGRGFNLKSAVEMKKIELGLM